MSYFGTMSKLKNMSGAEFKSFYTGFGLSQKEFAAELDYDPRQLRRWEREGATLPRHILYAIEGFRAVHKKVNRKQ
jgi:DNA-binding transcriptional regulator YiaG